MNVHAHLFGNPECKPVPLNATLSVPSSCPVTRTPHGIQCTDSARCYPFQQLLVLDKTSPCLLIIRPFHKFKPSAVPQGAVDSRSTPPSVTWKAVTRVEGIPCCVATTHAGYPSHGGRYRAESCMALGRDSSVDNGPFEEPGRAPLYVGLPSVWASRTVTLCFPPFCRRVNFLEIRQT